MIIRYTFYIKVRKCIRFHTMCSPISTPLPEQKM